MAYCPKCKEEYEDDVKMCAECHIELVKNLEDAHLDRMLMVVNSEDEANKVVDYLKYSKIETGSFKLAENEHKQKVYVVYVDEDDWKNATKVMQGYVMTEKEEPNMEDYYFDEYEMIDFDEEDKLSEIKSSYMSFLGVGLAAAVLGILDLMDVFDLLPGNIPIMLTVIGIIFILIGLFTRNSMSDKEENAVSIKDEFEELYAKYVYKYPVESFSKRHKIKTDGLDEGAKYFAVMDLIVKEVKSMNLTDNEKMVNTIADRFYNEL